MTGVPVPIRGRGTSKRGRCRVPSIEVWHDGKSRRLARREVAVDVADRSAVLRLIAAEARRLRVSAGDLRLEIWDGRAKKWVTHRA